MKIFDENKILKQCIKGKRKAQEALYQHFAPKMLAIALRYTSGRLEAEDVLQETFIKVFEKINSFRNDCPLGQWIKRILINTALKQNRSKLYLYPAIDIDSLDHSYDDWKLDQYSMQELINFVQQLAPRYRTVFNLYAIEGYQHKEIAQMLNISEGTSKSQYARARGILRQMITKEKQQYERVQS